LKVCLHFITVIHIYSNLHFKIDDDFDWEDGDSNTSLLGLGPSVDHTFGNQNGHYIFIGNYFYTYCIFEYELILFLIIENSRKDGDRVYYFSNFIINLI
jgi:hypothetical protein